MLFVLLIAIAAALRPGAVRRGPRGWKAGGREGGYTLDRDIDWKEEKAECETKPKSSRLNKAPAYQTT